MRDNNPEIVDAVVIGGGFYGLRIALFLHEQLGVQKIAIIEKEKALMSRASYVNQARVHNGYHYPRSLLTGYRSAVNFPTFVEEYKPAIVSDFDKYYSIARHLSKVNAGQFRAFSEKIGSDIAPASPEIEKLFNPHLIEKTFLVKEYAFDSHILRDLLVERIAKYKGSITIHNEEEVQTVDYTNNQLGVTTNKQKYLADKVFNCTYSQINALHRRSGLPLVGLKHEITEMCLVELPKGLENFSVTVMDGPFFSIMPFPSRKLHTLSHVRYTPHTSWIDNEETPDVLKDSHKYYDGYDLHTNYKKMESDVLRYVPALKGMKLRDTISEVKTVLVKSESDDSRPILFKSNLGFPGYTCIMGGKVDNIYDVFVDLEVLYGKK
ncbi:MAG: FAD-binding oxidoreductase [Candidatus Saccharibacteria bacterium]|nr:MAG: FAD-binding oxidoreductase [Candidatus Saccharibacteria bacterium]